MRYDEIPGSVLDQARSTLGAAITATISGDATIVRKSHRSIDEQAHRDLRALSLAARPAGNRVTQLIHVWETYPALIPPRRDARAGPWTLGHVQVKPNMHALWYNQLTPGLHLRYPTPRTIPVLSKNDPGDEARIWMSTADMELATMSDSLEECHGHVLVAGLGLGVFPTLAARRAEVTSVTIVEIDSDIIAISGDYVAEHGVRVIHSSIEDFAQSPPPGTPAFDYCFYDVWPYIQDPYAEEERARATVAPLMAPTGTISLWCQALNDRKRHSMREIAQCCTHAVRKPRAGQTCYSCADELVSSVADLCIQCAIGTWKDSPHLQGQPFPIDPEDIPEVAFIRQAQRALESLEPQVLTNITARARLHAA